MDELMQKYFVRRENDHRELGDTFYYEGTKLKVNKTTDGERACKKCYFRMHYQCRTPRIMDVTGPCSFIQKEKVHYLYFTEIKRNKK